MHAIWPIECYRYCVGWSRIAMHAVQKILEKAPTASHDEIYNIDHKSHM